MASKEEILNGIIEQGFLPLYFNKDTQVSIDLMKTLYKCGVRSLEYTNRGDDALQNFKAMKAVRDTELPEMKLGIGTIKNTKDAQAFIDAGADFLIGPGYEQGVADLANKTGIFYAPGCMTPSEIITAENNGIQLIKLFPGNILGPEFMAGIKEVFRNLKFMPTGGVDLDLGNLSAWFTAGVCAVGMGSKLITKKIMEDKDYATLETKLNNASTLLKKPGNKLYLQPPVNWWLYLLKNDHAKRKNWKIPVDDLRAVIFATTINYLDRQVLSLTWKDHIVPEFHWTDSAYGDITSIFSLVYAFSMLFAGKFVDWIDTKKGFMYAIFLWSVGALMHAYCGIATAGVLKGTWFVGFETAKENLKTVADVSKVINTSVAFFIVARIVLAIGESGNFPAAIKTTAEFFPKKDRGFATSVFNSGATVGAMLAPLTIPYIAEAMGWEMTFVIIGAFGFLWMFFWQTIYQKPHLHPKVNKAELAYIQQDDVAGETQEAKAIEAKRKLSLLKAFQYKQTWAFAVGKFLTDGVWWFFLFWTPAYLKDVYGLSGIQAAPYLTVLYAITMFSLVGGWLPSYFIAKKNMDPYSGRMRAMLIFAFFPLLSLLAQPSGNISIWLPVIIIGIAGAAHQSWSANIFSTVSDMFPKYAVATVTGIGGMAGGLGSFLINKGSGKLFDHAAATQMSFMGFTGKPAGYFIIFSVCAIVYLIAWFIMKRLVPKYKVITDL